LDAGHSLGGFTAACSAIFFKDILRVTTFESPGLTSFYHSLARQEGSKEYWQQRVVNYLSVPNPINTCQRHLGLMIRWAARNSINLHFLSLGLIRGVNRQYLGEF